MNTRLLGLDDTELVTPAPLSGLLHPAVVDPLLNLMAAARQAGFRLQVASSFRSFERQLLIWNAKAQGVRSVLDDQGQVLDLNLLTDLQKIHAILRWSALPGASRHHWGTDVDVFDSAAVSVDYRLQLVQQEYCEPGPFAAFEQWLSQAIAERNSFNFYRPYSVDRGGVAPEPWHISYAPIADLFAQQRTEQMLFKHLSESDFALKTTVLKHFSSVYERYIYVPDVAAQQAEQQAALSQPGRDKGASLA